MTVAYLRRLVRSRTQTACPPRSSQQKPDRCFIFRPYVLKSDLEPFIPREYVDSVFLMLLPVDDTRIVLERCQLGIARAMKERRHLLEVLKNNRSMVGDLRQV